MGDVFNAKFVRSVHGYLGVGLSKKISSDAGTARLSTVNFQSAISIDSILLCPLRVISGHFRSLIAMSTLPPKPEFVAASGC